MPHNWTFQQSATVSSLCNYLITVNPLEKFYDVLDKEATIYTLHFFKSNIFLLYKPLNLHFLPFSFKSIKKLKK